MTNVSLTLHPNRPVAETVAIAKLAEDAGFNGIWIPDENPAPSYRNTYLTMGAIAHATTKIRIGPGVTPIYQKHPILTLVALNTLHEISNGRVIIGIGPGGSVTLKPLRIPTWDRPIRMMRETIMFYRRLMAGEVLTDPYSMIQGVSLKLDPLPDPPMEIALALRGPQMARVAGGYADYAYMAVPRSVQNDTIHIIKEAAAKKGRSDKIKVTNSVTISITEDLDVAAREVGGSLCYMICDTPPSIRERLGISEDLVERLRVTLAKKGMKEAAKMITPEIASSLSAIGTADRCLDAIKEFLKAGLDEIVISPKGPRPLKETIEILKTDILPHILSH
ncbi:MAG: LLM class flavin-dependent oxidoreductase [Candidatus Ranarchaeia archaeon]